MAYRIVPANVPTKMKNHPLYCMRLDLGPSSDAKRNVGWRSPVIHTSGYSFALKHLFYRYAVMVDGSGKESRAAKAKKPFADVLCLMRIKEPRTRTKVRRVAFPDGHAVAVRVSNEASPRRARPPTPTHTPRNNPHCLGRMLRGQLQVSRKPLSAGG